jgi:predicted transcriptional regulator
MKKPTHLTPGEFELMEIIWPLGEASVKEVWTRLDPARGLAYTTVMTVLDKMHHKGVLAQRKKGKAFLYSPIIGRDQALREILEHVCHVYFHGSYPDMSGFVAANPIRQPAAVEIPAPQEPKEPPSTPES